MFQLLGFLFSVRVLMLGSVLGPASAGLPTPQTTEPEPGTQNTAATTESSEPRTPPAFWCPMHPNVRGGDAAAKCNECGMALVAIPDRSDRSYWLDVTAEPASVPARRPVRLQLAVRDRATNEAVTQFDEMHERLMHLFIVSSDLQYFDHVHPAAVKEGVFEIPLTLPSAGMYRLVADLLPTGGAPQTLQHTVLTTGHVLGSAKRPAEPRIETLDATDGDVRARLTGAAVRTGDDAHLVVELTDARSGAPVTDVEPYLGAWGHMFLASHDLADVVHSHPLIEETTAGGPTITFQTLFARSGWYRVWTQVQRRGRLLTFGFTVRVVAAL